MSSLSIKLSDTYQLALHSCNLQKSLLSSTTSKQNTLTLGGNLAINDNIINITYSGNTGDEANVWDDNKTLPDPYLLYDFIEDPLATTTITNKSPLSDYSDINGNIINTYIAKTGLSGDIVSGIIAWYKFDGDFNDSSGNGYDLSNNLAVINTTTQKKGTGCVSFATTNSHAIIPTTLNPYSIWNGKGIAFSLWFKGNNDTSGTWGRLFEFGNNNVGTNPTYHIVVATKTGGGKGIYINIKDNGTDVKWDDTTIYLDNNWHHLVWSISSTGVWTVYIDGINKNVSVTKTIPNITYTRAYFARSLFAIDAYFTGNIDDFRIYNRVLSELEVKVIYSNTFQYSVPYSGNTSTLLTWYKFDGDFNDSSGNGNTITNYNDISFNYTLQKRGTSCLYFNGNSQYCQLPSTLNFGATNAISFCCWFRFDTTALFQRIFDFGLGENNENILLFRNGTTNQLRFGIRNGSTYDDADFYTFTDGTYYHIAIVLIKTGTTGTASNTLKIYINGNLILDSPNNRRYPTSIPTGYTKCYLGRSNWTVDSYLTGFIDDFRIYTNALTLEEVKQIYIEDIRYTGSQTGLICWYKFDNGLPDGLIVDSAGSRNLTKVNAVLSTTDKMRGDSATRFVNTSSYYEVANTGGVFTPAIFSICCWFKIKSRSTVYQTIASARGSPNLIGWTLYIPPNSQYIDLWCGNGTVTQTQLNIGDISLNTWTHLCITMNSGSIKAYYNGILSKTATQTYPVSTAPLNMRIGAGANESTTPLYFLSDGSLIDDFRMYSRELTSTEVKDICGYTLTRTQGRMPSTYSYYWNGVVSELGDNSYITLPKSALDPISSTSNMCIGYWAKYDNPENDLNIINIQFSKTKKITLETQNKSLLLTYNSYNPLVLEENIPQATRINIPQYSVTIAHRSHSSTNVVIVCDVIFPQTITSSACLYECGGPTINGCAILRNSIPSVFRVRCGGYEGITYPNLIANIAYVDITDYPKDGLTHKVIVEINVDRATITLYIDGLFKGMGKSLNNLLYYGKTWAGLNEGGYGLGGGDQLGSESHPGRWDANTGASLVGNLRMYPNVTISDYHQTKWNNVLTTNVFNHYAFALEYNNPTLTMSLYKDGKTQIPSYGGTFTNTSYELTTTNDAIVYIGSENQYNSVVKINSTTTTKPIAIDDNYQYYAFTSTTATQSITFDTDTVCDILVVGGGGGGGGVLGGGGGGGAVVYISNAIISQGVYNVVVGTGGASVVNTNIGIKGGNSSFGGIIAEGGGGGGYFSDTINGQNGGSGGGGGADFEQPTPSYPLGGSVGSGSTLNGFQGTIYQNSGGSGLARITDLAGGGGGGAGSIGLNGNVNDNGNGGNGGTGIQINIDGNNYYYGGGGGGCTYTKTAGSGGLGGGGAGARGGGTGTSGGGSSINTGGSTISNSRHTGGSGGANTGGGGGGGGWEGVESPSYTSGSGGSGIVIIRWAKTSPVTININDLSSSYLENLRIYNQILYENDWKYLLTTGEYFKNMPHVQYGNITAVDNDIVIPALNTSHIIPYLKYDFVEDPTLYNNTTLTNQGYGGATMNATVSNNVIDWTIDTKYIGTNKNLMAWFKFDGNYSDFSGNGLVLTPAGAGSLTFVTDKQRGTHSLNFPGNANLTSLLSVNGTSFTICFWVKPVLASSANWIFRQGTLNETRKQLQVGYRTPNVFSFSFYVDEIDYNTTNDNNTWVHWSLSYDSSKRQQKMYKNGVLVASKIIGGDVVLNSSLNIGLSGGSYFNGNLDDFRVYNRVIKTSEISEIYGPYNTLTNKLPGSLLVWYKFDGDYTDSSGNGRTLVTQGSPTFNTSSFKRGSSSLSVSLGNGTCYTGGITLPSTSVSICCWAFINGTQVQYRKLFSMTYGTSANMSLYSHISFNYSSGANNIWDVDVANLSTGLSYSLNVDLSSYINTWFHMAITMTSSTMYVYINGNTTPFASKTTGVIAVDTTNSFNRLCIGGWRVNLDPTNDTFSHCFTGLVDDFRMYSKELSATEISDIYNSQDSNLLAWYKFDGNYNDSSGNNNTITNYDTTFNNILQKTGTQCLYFNGNSQYCQLPSTLNFGATNAISFCCWFRFDATALSERIFDFGLGENNENILLFRNTTTNQLRFGIRNGSTRDDADFYTFTDGTYYHIAIVLIKTGTTGTASNTLKIYINGNLILDSPNNRRYPTSIPTGYTKCYLGRSNWTVNTYLTGFIDDFRIYTIPLSEADVKAIYGHKLTRQIGYKVPYNYKWNGLVTSTNNYGVITLPQTVITPLTSSINFSVSFWVKFDSLTESDYSILKLIYNSSQTYLDIGINDTMTYFVISNGSGTTTYKTSWDNVNTIGVYNHYVYTFQYTNSIMTIKLYKNGLLCQTNIRGLYSAVGFSFITPTSSSKGYLGYDSVNPEVSKMSLEDFRIFDKTLNENEIYLLFDPSMKFEKIAKDVQIANLQNQLDSLYELFAKYGITP